MTAIIRSICDNKGLIMRLEQYKLPHRLRRRLPLKGDSDVCRAIRNTHTSWHTTKYEHVKGHQDSNPNNSETLTRAAVLNIRADQLATAYHNKKKRTALDRNREKVLALPGFGAQLTINGRTITSKHAKYIRSAAISQDIREYMTTKYHWTNKTCNTINWEAHGNILRQLPTTKQTRILKFIHEWLPSGKRKH